MTVDGTVPVPGDAHEGVSGLDACSRQSSIVGAAELHDPVRLPRLAAVGGVGLLPLRRAGIDARPDETHRRRRAVDVCLAVERAHALLEPALHRRIDLAGGIA